MPLDTNAPTCAIRAGTRPAAAVHAGDACARSATPSRMRSRSRPSRAPARWSMSAASISPNSPWCWSRTSRCARARRALLCRHGGAGRRAAGACAAGKADRDRLAGRDPRRWRAGRRRAARLAAGRARGRAAGLAGVRRDDPHRVDGRATSRACIRWSPRWRKKASTTSAPAQLVESFARHLMVAHRRLAGARLRRRCARNICSGCRAKAACAATSTRTAICWCGASARPRSSAGRSLPALAAPSWLDPKTRRAARVKLLRTIRLDPSDTFVFERAAEPGEWAVSGASCSGTRDAGEAGRQGALGVSRRLSRRRSRSAGRRWCRSSRRARQIAPRVVEHAGAATGRAFRRAGHRRRRAPRRRRKSRSPLRSAISRRIR